MARIGIHLGTTYSVVAVLREKPEIIPVRGQTLMPSVVTWDADEGELLVGQPAKNKSMVYPSVVSVKRHMGTRKRFTLGGKSYTPVDISAMILRELASAASEALCEPVDSAMITIPAYFNEAQSEATKEAAKLAGFKSVKLLAEPIAAAVAYGAEETVLVYDLGGGTFDVAIIDCFDCFDYFDYTMLGLASDNHLGADDFDRRLMNRLAKEVQEKHGVDLMANPEARQLAKTECERVKIALSSRQVEKIRFQTVIGETMVNVLLPIKREEYEEMIRDLVESSLKKVDEAIELAEKNPNREGFSRKDIQTVLLVGGSTYTPCVRDAVEKHFGFKPSTRIHADHAVAMGAAIQVMLGPSPKGVHRIKLEGAALETSKIEIELKGRTTPGSEVEAKGAAGASSVKASEDGRFHLSIALAPETTNEIEIVARSPGGEVRKVQQSIIHSSNAKEQISVAPKPTVSGVVPRALGIGVIGDNNRFEVIIPAQTEIPCIRKMKVHFVGSNAVGRAGTWPIEVYEGVIPIPYAPLNTLLWTVQMKTPPCSGSEPLEISFQYTTERLLKVAARMVNYPDRVVDAEFKVENPIGRRLDVIERTERVLNIYADEISPEVKGEINIRKQALKDLCKEFQESPDTNGECFAKIKEIGLELHAQLDRIDRTDAISQRQVFENAQFTVYRPQTVQPEKWCPLLAFAHLASRPLDSGEDEPDPIEKVKEEAKVRLGKVAGEYKDLTQDSTRALPRGGEITLLPDMPGVEFNPRNHTFLWEESVHSVEFRMRASKEIDGTTARGHLSAYWGGIIVAEIALAIRVDSNFQPKAEPVREELAARPYRNIFASYSHRDAWIVERFEEFAGTLGDRYFRDCIELRAGEEWNGRLARMIEQADVFQLFWSSNSMCSPFVRQEWEHALSLGRPHFVRPTYWEDPLPESPAEGLPPETLRRLHFHRLSPGVEVQPANAMRSKVAAPAPQARGREGRRAGEAMTSGIGMTLCWCPPGKFVMGSPAGELGRFGNEDHVDVELTRGFWMGKYPVTQAEYKRMTGANASGFKGERLPVETVSWDEAVEFCAKLTDAERAAGKLPAGWNYCLPTEAQWEYACRAGTTTALNSGKNLTSEDGVCPNLDAVGWYDKNSGGKTHPGGEKQANAWGLHDMHGNVWEWCADWYADRLGGGHDPAGPNAGKYRVLRGGSWRVTARDCRSAARVGFGPDGRVRRCGFRVCLVPGPADGQR